MAEKKESAASGFLTSKLFKIIIGSTLLILPILLFLLIPGYKAGDGFKTLAEVEKYAAVFDEKKISMENTNLDKPEYTAFYKSQRLGFFGAKLKTLGLSSGLPWTVHSYKNLLEKAIDLAKPKNYSGVFAFKIATSPATKIVVWGDVQGAFHSLVRDLRELVKLGIIDENLKVASPDNYLVFMGDVISRSPFIMETVSLVSRLILNNPENVFYLRGNHESNNYWNGKGLERELKLRARTLDKGAETPLEKLTNDFFDTLPALVYAGILPNDTAQFVRISHEGADGDGKIAEINDAKLAPFLSTKLTGKIGSFNYKDIKEGASTQPIEIKAIVKAEIKRKTYQAMDGLRLTSPENGVTAWTMLSCPTETYQKGLEYFFDAFSIIQAGAKIEDWTITLHSQDVRTLSGFKTRQHNLISGQVIGGDGAVAAPTPPVAAPTTQSSAAVPQAQNQVQVTVPAAVPVVIPAQPQAVQVAVPAQASAQTATPVAAPQQQPTPSPQASTSAVLVAQSPAPIVATPAQTQNVPQAAPVVAAPVPVVAQTSPVQTSVPASTAAQSVATPVPAPVQQNPAVAPVAQVQAIAPVVQASQGPVAPQVQTQEVLTATPAPAQPQVVQTTPVAVAPQQTPASAVPVTTLTAAAVQPAAPQPVAQVVPAQVVVAQPAQSQTPAPVAAPQGSGEITFKPYKSE